ncbi:outer membrane beta-barrel protein [Shewanella sp. WPAGA9]|uniref:outer membrane beta-barrel protein n=1 Tax=Shewanella sp. ENK2 TaxID=2775245 RepID=UPI001784812D|nr:putative porin [Shewanella sp. WPAGA9]
MTINKISLSVILYLASCASFAADTSPSSSESSFHHQAEIGFLDTSESSDGLASATYSYFFQGVDQTDVPLELAPYLSQSSVVSARYATTDHQDLYALSGEYIFDSRFFIGGAYSLVTQEREWFDSNDEDTYEINAGYYFNPYAKVTLSYLTYSHSNTYSNSNHAWYDSYNSQSSEDYDAIAAKYEHYLPFEKTSGLMLTALVTYAEIKSKSHSAYTTYTVNGTDDLIPQMIESSNKGKHEETTLIIDADWYITNAWSVGASYKYLNYDSKSTFSYSSQSPEGFISDTSGYISDDSFNVYTVNTSYFWRFSKYISARASIEQLFIDSDSDTSFGIAINARF